MADDEERKTRTLGCHDLTVVDQRPHILPDISDLSPLSLAPPVSQMVVAKHQQAGLRPRLRHSSVVGSEELGIAEQQQLRSNPEERRFTEKLPVADEDESSSAGLISRFPHVTLQLETIL